MKEKIKIIEEEKMTLELYVVDVVDDHKMKMNAMRLKMDAMRLKLKKIRNMPLIMRLGIIMPLDPLLPLLRSSSHLL